MQKQIEQFYVEKRTELLKKLYHRAGGPENAEDILQEAFCRALKYQNSFDPSRQELGAWFNTILNNALKTFKRDEKAMGTYVELEEEISEAYEMSQTDGDLARRIKERIEGAKGYVRDVLHLYFLKEYRPREIRDVLDVPVKTVDTIVFRFKQEMQSTYREETA